MKNRFLKRALIVPAELVLHGYNIVIILYLAAFHYKMAGAFSLAAVHAACGMAYALFQINRNRSDNIMLQIATVWLPLLILSLLHYESGIFNHFIYRDFLDPYIVVLDQAYFGCEPYLALHTAMPWNWLAQLTHFAYFSFYLILVVPVTILYFNEHEKALMPENPEEFWKNARPLQEMLFAVMLVMTASFLMFIIFPVKGPTEYRSVLFHDSTGMVAIMNFLYRVGDLDGGAMPSSHVAVSLVITLYSFTFLKKYRWMILILFAALCFSTVYNAYHYGTDVIAGLIMGWLFFRISQNLSKLAVS